VAKQPRRERGALERGVVATLVAAARPLTPAEVLVELGEPLAYTTVMTTLARLVDKGALARDLVGRTYVYRLVTDAAALDAALTARRMTRLLDGSDRAAALSRFVADLLPEDERLLAALLPRATAPPATDDGPGVQ
jgi:predicted transcriptional regulator